MAHFQLLTCSIAVGGDVLNVVAKHRFSPVTYPEMLVLKYLHGEAAVFDVHDCGHIVREDAAEMKRLIETYGAFVREKLFPGAGMRLPSGDNKYRPQLNAREREMAVPAIPDLPLDDITGDEREGENPTTLDYSQGTGPNGNGTGSRDGYVPVPNDPPVLVSGVPGVSVPVPVPVPVPAPVSRRPVPVTP